MQPLVERLVPQVGEIGHVVDWERDFTRNACRAAIVTELDQARGRIEVKVQYFLPRGAPTPRNPGGAHPWERTMAEGSWHRLTECPRLP